MRISLPNLSFLIALILLCAPVAEADSMRCGSKLISDGDSKVKVMLRCGEPFYKETVGSETQKTEEVEGVKLKTGKGVIRYGEVTKGESVSVTIERWYYITGRTSFIRILTFKGDKVDKIELGEKPQ